MVRSFRVDRAAGKELRGQLVDTFDAGQVVHRRVYGATASVLARDDGHVCAAHRLLTAREHELRSIGLEDLLKPHALEERIYRLRCVEAWSMVIPWVGIPLGDILKRFEPTSKAKYVAFETLHDPEQMPGQRRSVLRWPYEEGLRIDEASHPLAILAVGMYGEALPPQNGAPLRLSPKLRTPPTRSRRRTPRWGQAIEHGPGTTRSPSHRSILQSVVHSQRATSRRTTTSRRPTAESPPPGYRIRARAARRADNSHPCHWPLRYR